MLSNKFVLMFFSILCHCFGKRSFVNFFEIFVIFGFDFKNYWNSNNTTTIFASVITIDIIIWTLWVHLYLVNNCINMEPAHKVQNLGFPMKNGVWHHLSPKVWWVVCPCPKVASIGQRLNFLHISIVPSIAKAILEPWVMGEAIQVFIVLQAIELNIFQSALNRLFW